MGELQIGSRFGASLEGKLNGVSPLAFMASLHVPS
jgi:hypothetical protein